MQNPIRLACHPQVVTVCALMQIRGLEKGKEQMDSKVTKLVACSLISRVVMDLVSCLMESDGNCHLGVACTELPHLRAVWLLDDDIKPAVQSAL